jgi:hypothetical protein
VTQTSDALTLEQGVFAQRDPKKIAASLKRSAMRSKRRKADPFRSRKTTLMRAKGELRKQFGKA